MKRQVFVILTTLSLLLMLMASSVDAQSNLRLKVNIPFEFSVGGTTLPSGEYTVRYWTQSVLVIQSIDHRASKPFFALSTEAGTTPDESSLVFNRYGDQYFLSTIWTAGRKDGLALRKPDAEKQLIRAMSTLGQTAAERQTVSIVAYR